MPPVRHWLAGVAALVALLQPGTPPQLRGVIVAQGFSLPLAFVQHPSDSGVQFVVEQGGRVRVLDHGILRANDFLNVSADIVVGGEQGLLGFAFAPDFATSGRVYVNFTNRSGDTVVARFKRSAANPLVADSSSRFDLQWSTGERVIHQPFVNHNGGNLVFGPDGYLYIGMGDGGSGDDPGNRAQDAGTLLGKMLRIDVSVPDLDPTGFRIPPDNPFLRGQPVSARPEIWSFGLRNPWRFSFDDPSRGGTGALVIGDVGQNAYEEIDYEPRGRGGRNYGWRLREGTHPNVTTTPPAFGPLVEPIEDYSHSVGICVIGGFVYRGLALGARYHGRYFFADLLGRVWSAGLAIDRTTGEATVSDIVEHTGELGGTAELSTISSFGVDAAGELYLVNQSQGRIIRVSSTSDPEDRGRRDRPDRPDRGGGR